MFQPEVEDMLPRIAPRPTTALSPHEPLAKPSVPEVSILFHQPTIGSNNGSNGTHQTTAQKSYASWKKQMLPKVTYPPGAENAAMQNYTETCSKVYPLRNIPQTHATENIAYSDGNSDSLRYRRSLESCTPPHYSQTPEATFNNSNKADLQPNLQRSQRNSQVPNIPPAYSIQKDVLQISAAVQTDFPDGHLDSQVTGEFLSKLATKDDFEQILSILVEMRREQHYIKEMCNVIMDMKKPVERMIPKRLIDVATQYEESRDEHAHEIHTIPKALSSSQQVATSHQIFKPTRLKPDAHSTRYPQSSPCPPKNLDGLQEQHKCIIPYTTTAEKSLVMNELALKYLPNDKITELMNDIHLTPISNKQRLPFGIDNNDPSTQNAMPLRNIENFAKSPNDISNASYKYLKKYRLLPEEQNIGHDQEDKKNVHHGHEQISSPVYRQSPGNLLDLDSIRRQPKFL